MRFCVQFTTAAVALTLNLANRSHYVSEKRLRYRGWPCKPKAFCNTDFPTDTC